MRRMRTLLLALLGAPMVLSALLAWAPGAQARDGGAREASIDAANSFSVLCYHEVRNDVRDYPDPLAVNARTLVAHFAWLRGNGHTPVSLDAILAARAGGKALPPKAVLLTFDDGYLSFYTHVYPLLREFRYPAVLGVVGKWIDNPPGTRLLYGEKNSVPEASFPTWGEVREMAGSGLVEIASHTYDLHHGVPANPQGNLLPAATTRVYDAATGNYEADAVWRARVSEDLLRNTSTIERETGRRPRVIVWPYGSYNEELVHIASAMGMPIALTLEDGANTPQVPLSAVRRILVSHNPPLGDFVSELRGPRAPAPMRPVRVSLDRVYDADPIRQERNLSALLDRVTALEPSHIFLEAGADPDGDGFADAAYFPTRHLPLRADLLSRVAWQLGSRAKVQVFALLQDLRLLPDQAVQTYADLARHAAFDGLVFMQGAAQSEEDTARFVAATQVLADAARRWRAPLKIARGFAAPPEGAPDAAPGLAGRIAALAAASDYVVIALDAKNLNRAPKIQAVGSPPPAVALPTLALPGAVTSKLVYLLEGASDPAAGETLARRMRALQLSGALNFGYGVDDPSGDAPPFARTAPAMSLRIHPR